MLVLPCHESTQSQIRTPSQAKGMWDAAACNCTRIRLTYPTFKVNRSNGSEVSALFTIFGNLWRGNQSLLAKSTRTIDGRALLAASQVKAKSRKHNLMLTRYLISLCTYIQRWHLALLIVCSWPLEPAVHIFEEDALCLQ